MEYRKLPKGNEKISVIGFGGGSICEAGEAEAIRTISEAIRRGINYFDLAVTKAADFACFRTAFAGRRDQVYLQMHFGADYSSGEYGRTIDPDAIRRSMDWMLKTLDTDYIDFGFIHCIDEKADLDSYLAGNLAYIQGLKEQGVVRHIGMSTHTPNILEQVLDMGLIDVVMFSVNPAYDYHRGDLAIGGVDERQKLYQRCQRENVGITVMKPFAGGQLLDENLSPFKKALTKNQCIQYALDKPGVLNVLPGFRGMADLEEALGYLDAAPEERDYSILGGFAPPEANGKCVYCSPCHPCPKGLDIALINKYYDLAKVGDALAKDHYRHLSLHAGDCIKCGSCNKRCPFHVKQMERMEEIQAYFGL